MDLESVLIKTGIQNGLQIKETFAAFLQEDFKIRKALKKKLYLSGVPKIEIERSGNKVKLNIFTAKPGMVIVKKVDKASKKSKTKLKK